MGANVSVELATVLVGFASFIFWLAGLSFANKRNVDDIKELKDRLVKDVDILHGKHNDLSVEIRRDVGEMKVTLARIEQNLLNREKES